MRSPLWQPEENEYMSNFLYNLEIKADSLFLLGCLNSVDVTHPAWGGDDGLRNFFIGDSAGEMTIGYASGKTDTIPLIFGHTAWWDNNYKASPEPFRSDKKAKIQLDDALCVANGVESYTNTSKNYYLKIKLRDELVKWIRFTDNPERVGYYQVEGLTFSGIGGKLSSEKYLTESGDRLSDDKISWSKKS